MTYRRLKDAAIISLGLGVSTLALGLGGMLPAWTVGLFFVLLIAAATFDALADGRKPK